MMAGLTKDEENASTDVRRTLKFIGRLAVRLQADDASPEVQALEEALQQAVSALPDGVVKRTLASDPERFARALVDRVASLQNVKEGNAVPIKEDSAQASLEKLTAGELVSDAGYELAVAALVSRWGERNGNVEGEDLPRWQELSLRVVAARPVVAEELATAHANVEIAIARTKAEAQDSDLPPVTREALSKISLAEAVTTSIITSSACLPAESRLLLLAPAATLLIDAIDALAKAGADAESKSARKQSKRLAKLARLLVTVHSAQLKQSHNPSLSAAFRTGALLTAALVTTRHLVLTSNQAQSLGDAGLRKLRQTALQAQGTLTAGEREALVELLCNSGEEAMIRNLDKEGEYAVRGALFEAALRSVPFEKVDTSVDAWIGRMELARRAVAMFRANGDRTRASAVSNAVLDFGSPGGFAAAVKAQLGRLLTVVPSEGMLNEPRGLTTWLVNSAPDSAFTAVKNALHSTTTLSMSTPQPAAQDLEPAPQETPAEQEAEPLFYIDKTGRDVAADPAEEALLAAAETIRPRKEGDGGLVEKGKPFYGLAHKQATGRDTDESESVSDWGVSLESTDDEATEDERAGADSARPGKGPVETKMEIGKKDGGVGKKEESEGEGERFETTEELTEGVDDEGEVEKMEKVEKTEEVENEKVEEVESGNEKESEDGGSGGQRTEEPMKDNSSEGTAQQRDAGAGRKKDSDESRSSDGSQASDESQHSDDSGMDEDAFMAMMSSFKPLDAPSSDSEAEKRKVKSKKPKGTKKERAPSGFAHSVPKIHARRRATFFPSSPGEYFKPLDAPSSSDSEPEKRQRKKPKESKKKERAPSRKQKGEMSPEKPANAERGGGDNSAPKTPSEVGLPKIAVKKKGLGGSDEEAADELSPLHTRSGRTVVASPGPSSVSKKGLGVLGKRKEGLSTVAEVGEVGSGVKGGRKAVENEGEGVKDTEVGEKAVQETPKVKAPRESGNDTETAAGGLKSEVESVTRTVKKGRKADTVSAPGGEGAEEYISPLHTRSGKVLAPPSTVKRTAKKKRGGEERPQEEGGDGEDVSPLHTRSGKVVVGDTPITARKRKGPTETPLKLAKRY